MADKTLSKDELIEAIKGMSVLDLSELVKALEETFGVSAAAPMAMAAAPAAAAEAAPVEEKTAVRRRPHRLRRPEDPGHQGRPRAHRPGPQGGQGRGRRRAEAPSRKASPRTRPRTPRSSSRRPARASSSSRAASGCPCRGGRGAGARPAPLGGSGRHSRRASGHIAAVSPASLPRLTTPLSGGVQHFARALAGHAARGTFTDRALPAATPYSLWLGVLLFSRTR